MSKLTSDHLTPENVELVRKALGHCLGRTFNRYDVNRIIDAARSEVPVSTGGEPVAWRVWSNIADRHFLLDRSSEAEEARARGYEVEPLYAAPPPVLPDEVVRLVKALDWFGQNQNLSLEFDWSDADTDSLDWVVYRENGGINDREWTAIGSGPTPQAAILAAYKPFADRLPEEGA